MRSLGFAIVAASLVFSVGGVSVRAGDAESSELAIENGAADSCQVPEAPTTRTIQINPLRGATARAKNVFVLNSRGYNYLRPGELPVLEPGGDPRESPED